MRVDLGRDLADSAGELLGRLRTYTVRPGTVGEMVKAASTISRDIRADNFGKLEGYWITEIG
ncbi:hypothetical protein FNJ47_48705, partial [Bradyrhizobium sp. UFLA 03-164]|nr:hypothetical protein [Bradyrhizobium uaiense]